MSETTDQKTNISGKKLSTVFITRTAIMIAITLVFQYLGRFIPLGPNSNFIVGPLVNACLLITAHFVGIGSAAIVSVVTPLFAALTNTSATAPFVLVFSPFIAAGNFVFALMYWLLYKKGKTVAAGGTAIGAVIKFLLLSQGVKFMLGIKEMPGPAQTALTIMFGWPQLITAVIGGILALAVIAALERKVKFQKKA